jgi:hypothetical protein
MHVFFSYENAGISFESFILVFVFSPCQTIKFKLECLFCFLVYILYNYNFLQVTVYTYERTKEDEAEQV